MSEDFLHSLKKRGKQKQLLTPLHGPSKSSFRYLLSSVILLLGVKDNLNHLGNLSQTRGDTESEWEGQEGRGVQCLAAGLTAAASTQ